MNAEKLRISETTDGKPARPGFEDGPAPAPIDPQTGQHSAYWVLSAAERAKGFVRPVRTEYQHVGIRPLHPTRPLNSDEHQLYNDVDENGCPGMEYVAYEEYPKGESCSVGRFWTQKDLETGCGTNTTMSYELAATYSRDPSYYGATFCCCCRKHFPVEEFVWVERGRVTDERLGS